LVTGFQTYALPILAVGPSYATSTDGVFKSVDGGETWQAVNTGLFRGFPKVFLTSLAIDPTNPSILYVGTREAGIFKSTDGGGAWRAINTGLVNLDVETLAVDPKTP